MNIDELESKIKYYSEKYYQGEPEIDDQQFDALVDKLRQLNPNSEILKTGWGFEVKGNKVKHKYNHIGSLDKCKSYKEIPDQFKNKTIYLSPKLDGISAVLYYEKGNLVRAITRGDGEYGKDITDKLRIIEGTNIADKSFTGAVRGELIIHKDNWNILQNKYNDLISSRNFVAGIINRKDIDEDINQVHLVVYKIIGQENITRLDDKGEIIKWLQNNFKHCIPRYQVQGLNQIYWDSNIDQIFNEFKNNGYDLDGVVLSKSQVLYNSNTYGYEYTECAFKFQAESAITTIKDIEWTLSRTQRLVPVVIVEPVELSGAIINRVTANNAKWIKDMNLGIGSQIEIQRSNEVIPKILSVISEENYCLPDKCPICGEKLNIDGVDLKCDNNQCPNIYESDLEQWCESVGQTDGMQWTLMKQYLDLFNINNIEELYNSENKNKVLEYFESPHCQLIKDDLSATDQKAYQFFTRLYKDKINIETLLNGLNIPRLGNKTVEQLLNDKDGFEHLIKLVELNKSLRLDADKRDISYSELYMTTREKLLLSVKTATTGSLLANLNKFEILLDMIKCNRCDLSFTDNNMQSDKKYIAVTGSLESMKRKDFEQFINRYGYELTSNIKKCEYLIANKISSSSKFKDAQENNVAIISEKEFLELLK